MKRICRDLIPAALCLLLPADVLAAQEVPASSAATQAQAGAPASPVSSEPMQPAPGISTYRITPGDQIEIYVWGEERLQRTMRVLPDGTIAFPLVGQVSVAGHLPQEVETLIRSGLSGQYRGEVPQVTVSVIAPAPTQFTVLGRVGTPGTFKSTREINVLEALSLAGGGTEFANLDRIVILRKSADSLIPLEANIKPLMRGRIDAAVLERANLVKIQAGDTIIVP